MEQELTKLLQRRDDVIAAWLGGSAATGFRDEYSDIDYLMICEDDAVEDLVKLVDEFLQENYGVAKRFRVPEPSWHGFTQLFYKLDNTPVYDYLDISFLKRSLKDKFTGSGRHGQAKILFEKEPIIDTSPEPVEIMQNQVSNSFKRITDLDFVVIAEVSKGILRNRFTEAFTNYYQFIARYLSVVLNMKYRPEKVDFGLRYSYRDYPPEIAEWVENLFKVHSIEELETKFEDALSRYYGLLPSPPPE